jgi:HK97 family phage prohead protease
MQTKLLLRESAATLETRRADLRPGSYDEQKRTIEAVIATSNPVARRDATGPFNEILDVTGADLSVLTGAHVLNNHRQSSVEDIIGTVETAWVDGSKIVARLRLSERPEVGSIVAAIRSGDITGVSIGYEVSKWTDGTDGVGNRTRTATAWRVREVSFVAVPADPHARTRGSTNQIIRSLGHQAGVQQTVIDSLIDRGATEQEARNAILEDMMTRSAVSIRSAHNENSMDNSEAFVRAAGEALFARSEPGHQLSGPARQYVGLTIPEVAREVCRRSGINTTGLGASSLIERAMTTSDFPQILAETVDRTLRASYSQTTTSGIRQLARQTTAKDFRAKSKLMLDSSGVTLEKVNEHGEFKSGSLVEAGEAYRIDTFGKIIAITRQALINDDLGAFTDLARRLGQSTQAFEAQFLVDLVQSNSGVGPLMSDGKAVHHTDHGNIAGSGAAPSEITLSAARLAMRKQTGPGGGLITVTPKYLLIPPELETSVEKLLATIQATTTDDVNVFSKLVAIVEPRLTSATRWWLVAADVDGLEYAHLAGQPGPYVESRTGFTVDGVETKVRLDFGAGFVDWRGWYTNAGA